MNRFRTMFSIFFDCCQTADDNARRCVTSNCTKCSGKLDKFNDGIMALERRIDVADQDLRTLPDYKKITEQLSKSDDNSNFAECDPDLDDDSFATRFDNYCHRLVAFSRKCKNAIEFVEKYSNCFSNTWKQPFRKDDNAMSIPALQMARCQCNYYPRIERLNHYTSHALLIMSWLDKKIQICLDHSKATYSITYVPEEEGNQAISGIVIGEASANNTQNENPILNSSPVGVYSMNHKLRGRCIFFGHEKFKSKNVDQRDIGNEKKILDKTFTNMGFDFKAYIDLKHEGIKNVLNELAEINYENDDCICILISTHGAVGDLLWAKDVCYSFELFENTLMNIESLVNKPKILMVQSCRGSRIDKGIDLNKTSSRGQDETDNKSTKVPIMADFLKVFSCPPGFLSWRGWFFRALCESFQEFSETQDIETIVKIASNKMRTFVSKNDDEEKNGAKQVLYVEHTLDKMIYFKKKL